MSTYNLKMGKNPGEFKFICTCTICGTKYQMGRHFYNGKHIPRYKLDVCQSCYDSNRDGWHPDFETTLLSHLKENNIPIPERNNEGLYPRD
ncbi:MAG: hypothetical protein WGN25_18775 [Candidatus Electrothrix sp. GW3-4]|uniref:hypothetical protein n=1 Tax=Candidatus Electrothrix sp. GW3-4 TaxID=3126740 RepID=UPI0030D35765